MIYRQATSFDIPVFVSLDKQLFRIHRGLHPSTARNFLVPPEDSSLQSMLQAGLLDMQESLHRGQLKPIF